MRVQIRANFPGGLNHHAIKQALKGYAYGTPVMGSAVELGLVQTDGLPLSYLLTLNGLETRDDAATLYVDVAGAIGRRREIVLASLITVVGDRLRDKVDNSAYVTGILDLTD